MGLLDRLTELTRIKNDFDDEVLRQPRTPRERREAGPAAVRRADQLAADRGRVMDARAEEIGRLLAAGHTQRELSAHLDRADRHR